MAASANALYVLRLVIGARAGGRAFSTAVLTHPRSENAASRWTGSRPSTVSSAAASTSTSTSAFDAAVAQSDFLEDANDDYEAAATFLPEREPTAAAPIPWPTVFPHYTDVKPHHPRACDLIARLVAEGRFGPAHKVYDELRALHIPVHARQIYLSAALESLDGTLEGRANFLFWLALIPNRPAVAPSPKLKSIWHPIAYQLLDEHLDPDFLGDFLELAGKKGVLSAVLPPMASVLAIAFPPNVSERMVEKAIAAYTASTTSTTSTSGRAEVFRNTVAKQTTRWWNLYLRGLALADWDDAARALLYSPPDGVRWERMTRAVVLHQGLDRRERSEEASRTAAKEAMADPLATLMESRVPEDMNLADRVENAFDSTKLPLVNELADLQRILSSQPELLERFRKQFIWPPSTHAARAAPTVNGMWWYHAEVLRHVQDGDHDEALATFRRHFLWLGLPSLPTASEVPPEQHRSARRIPSIRVITTLLPSLIALSPDPAAFHRSYLSQRLSPALRPTEVTHWTIVREIGYRHGAEAANDAIHASIAADYDPGFAGWTALLLSLTGQGHLDTALDILGRMERQEQVGSSHYTMPPPTHRTYFSLIRVCGKAGRVADARLLLDRFKVWFEGSGRKQGSREVALAEEKLDEMVRKKSEAKAAHEEAAGVTGEAAVAKAQQERAVG